MAATSRAAAFGDTCRSSVLTSSAARRASGLQRGDRVFDPVDLADGVHGLPGDVAEHLSLLLDDVLLSGDEDPESIDLRGPREETSFSMRYASSAGWHLQRRDACSFRIEIH